MKAKHVFIGAFLTLGPFLLESCSSDSTPFSAVESGGEAGSSAGKGGASAGKGGSGASSGASGGAGRGGSGGAAGTGAGGGQGGDGAGGETPGSGGGGAAGEAGTGLVSGSGGEPSSGGEAGDGGDGGAPVSGGAPGAGGASGGSDAGAGQGGGDAGSDAGAGGRGTPEELKGCGYECVTDEDCESPGILKYTCDERTKRCATAELSCEGHDDCVAFASNWSVGCESDGDCLSPADVCVDAGGYGRCARAFGESTPCPLPDQVSLARVRFGTGEDVQVCGRTHGRCDGGACFLGCTGASDCGKGDGDTCDLESGRCTCTDDNECTSGAVSHCNRRTGRCDECASDFDCFLDPSRDVCVRGRCGCSSADVCSDVIFPAATPVCE